MKGAKKRVKNRVGRAVRFKSMNEKSSINYRYINEHNVIRKRQIVTLALLVNIFLHELRFD